MKDPTVRSNMADTNKDEYDSLETNPLINTSEPARTIEGILRGYEPVADGHGKPKGFNLDKDLRTEYGYYWEFEDMAEAAQEIAAATRQSLLAEIAERGPKWAAKAYYTKHPVLWKPTAPEGNAEYYDAGFNQANEEWRKLLTELRED